jgi:predicted SnoaL-like aldol condensation-catalyzing enzyme
MPGSIRAALRRYYTAVWQDGDVGALDELLTSDYVDHNPLPGFGGGRDAAKAMAAQVTAAMPGARLEVHHLIVEGNLAAAHWTMTWRPAAGKGAAGTGTEAGSRPGTEGGMSAAAGGRLRGHDFFRLRGGRICEVWHCEASQPGGT